MQHTWDELEGSARLKSDGLWSAISDRKVSSFDESLITGEL